ncbi:hypothetical protein A2572_01200 [Candidatus Collierbacteria bacterium RIFOXYD1_FULL_40_9]|uniref:Uncharacterized protein n=1 Tax=Candidatus Collierbacteria bacterium RIFOXYD1_FULL_40_9 TaxID=1817731 RepID=A0A1F5FP59_9BACT|nr:MAG: hypothetical protein A2572_01200 [Candidatus Collierbacteria bacterium RIFOXYD1_FULL_40_9]
MCPVSNYKYIFSEEKNGNNKSKSTWLPVTGYNLLGYRHFGKGQTLESWLAIYEGIRTRVPSI